MLPPPSVRHPCAMRVCATQGLLDMAGMLIEYGASITATDQYGKDAQDYAAAGGYVDLAKVGAWGPAMGSRWARSVARSGW